MPKTHVLYVREKNKKMKGEKMPLAPLLFSTAEGTLAKKKKRRQYSSYGMSCETLSINIYVFWGPTNAWLRALKNMLRKKIIKFSSEKIQKHC